MSMISPPNLFGNQRVSPLYQNMATGLTGTILLLGHADVADSNQIGEPFQVVTMQATINYLQADFNSPLVRALFEVYNAGCKDIWVVPVADMSEYRKIGVERLEPDVGLGGQTFYERYYDRLEVTYTLLKGYDFFEVVVPVEAPFHDSGTVDFCSQLAEFCLNHFTQTGSISIGVLGTRLVNPLIENSVETNYNDATINEMATDPRIELLGEAGKFIMVVVGEGVFMHPQVATPYNRSLEAVSGALISTINFDRSIAGRRLPGVSSTTMLNFSKDQIKTISEAKLNPVIKTQRGKRGFPFEVKLATDNSLGQSGSDYWAMTQMRIVAFVGNEIRDFGYSYIGESDSLSFKQAVKNFLDILKSNQLIVDYSLRITMETNSKAIVEVGLRPIFGIKNIYFTIETGPGV